VLDEQAKTWAGFADTMNGLLADSASSPSQGGTR